MPAGFIPPCQPKVAKRPPAGSGWVHELKHDGYRLQIHARDGRVRLYTMNGTNWSDRYPRIADDAARIKGDANIDAEVVCLDSKGIPQFELLHKQGKRRRSLGARFRSFRPRRRRSTQASVAGTQKRSCQTADPLAGRDSIRRTCRRPRRAHVRGDVRAWIGGHRKRRTSVYRSGPSKSWIKVKNPKAPAATRILDRTF